jgi:hypothetical protein
MTSTTSTAEVGLMPAPDGVTPDFGRTTDVQIAFIVVFAVTFALATIALALRVYTRAFVVKALGFDDRMFISYLGNVGSSTNQDSCSNPCCFMGRDFGLLH